MIFIILTIFVGKCLGMEEESRAGESSSSNRQNIPRDFRWMGLDGPSLLNLYCPMNTTRYFVNNTTRNAQPANPMPHVDGGIGGFNARPIIRDIPNLQIPLNISQDRMGVHQDHVHYIINHHDRTNLRQMRREPSRSLRSAILDLDNNFLPWGIGMKCYGERIFLITIKNTSLFRMGNVEFGDIKLRIPPGARSCIVWVYKESGIYRVVVELLHLGKWISKEFIETGPRTNVFRQIGLHINDTYVNELSFPVRNENVPPVDIVLSTNLDMNDPNWLRSIPPGVFIVDMPGNPYKYYEVNGSNVKMSSVKFGNVVVNFTGNQRKLVWTYYVNSLKHIRIESYSLTVWHGEVWAELGPGLNVYRIIDCWAFFI